MSSRWGAHLFYYNPEYLTKLSTRLFRDVRIINTQDHIHHITQFLFNFHLLDLLFIGYTSSTLFHPVTPSGSRNWFSISSAHIRSSIKNL